MSYIERRPSDFRLSLDVVDHNGVALFEPSDSNNYRMNEDSTIAPWIDVPPTPPPKNTPITKSFSKSSFSLIPNRQNSASSLLRTNRPSDTQSQLSYYTDSTKRRSQDDGESSTSRGVVYSGSSTYSGELRKPKSSKNITALFKIKRSVSKNHLRSDSDETEQKHPSLRSVVPLPEQKGSNVFNLSIPLPTSSSTTLIVAPTGRKQKKDKGKGKANDKGIHLRPPQNDDSQEYTHDLNLDSMDGIINFDLAMPAPGGVYTNGAIYGRDASSPSSGFDSAHSYSDRSLYHNNSYPPEWSDPFSTTPLQDKRKGMISGGKISPKSVAPNSIYRNGTAVGPAGSRSPTWAPPESWEINKNEGDIYNEASEAPDSDSDDFNNGISAASSSRRKIDASSHSGKKSINMHYSSSTSVTTVKESVRSTGRDCYPVPRSYKMRIYTQHGTYHVVSIGIDTTVLEINESLRRKLLKKEERVQYNLYLKEQGRERLLSPKECPAKILKSRMEQAGYDPDDGHHLLSADTLNILMKFFYKSQSLAGEDQIVLDHYAFIDLSGRGLRTIPVVLHQNADAIISLRLDRNPMLEIPLDFIQSCTTLRDLWLTHMSMKKVPASLRHSTTLHRLNLSRNCIRDLEEAHLDEIQGLLSLFLQNNRLERLPSNFTNLRSLVTLIISNNKFKQFPPVVTELENLHELDISFNSITELPAEIGKMRSLERLIIVGNQVTSFPYESINLVNLRVLDCRRNQISDLVLICMLPNLQSLSADHNAVHLLDLSLGPHLTTLDVSYNDITRLSIVPGPMGKSPYALTSLDVSYGKLSSLDDQVLSQLTSLRTLKIDHNQIRSIPDSLGELKWLEILSCTDNKLDALPSTIGRLQKLETLDAHNNSLTELPQSLWNCASLVKINVTSNLINGWHDPPVNIQDASMLDCGLAAPDIMMGRRPSTASVGSIHSIPPLVHSLEQLYLGENCLTDNVIQPLMIFKMLRVLNLSFNEIQDLPPAFFRNMVHLEEVYLSGNKLTSIPAEDFHRLTKLTTLFLNGNRLHTLPQELGKVPSLRVLDVGSNFLKYNINNWEFDWNWNFNTNLKYLNLSGNKRLQIKADSSSARMSKQYAHESTRNDTAMLSGFTSLTQLRVLGLMDVTITTAGKDTTIDIPDENMDRRVRTSLSTVCGMGYGIADALGKNDHLNMIDLVHEFHGRKTEAIFAMFGQTHHSRYLKPGTSPNKISKFLHDNFVNVFKTQLAMINEVNKTKLSQDGSPDSIIREGIKKALHWTFLKLNQDLNFDMSENLRKQSQAQGNGANNSFDPQYFRMGASGVALYFVDNTIYAANVGDALAVVSRQGVCHEISKKHDPYDRLETQRIRAAEGSISPPGLVNDEVEVSRSFGYFHIFPTMNARPDIFVYDLSERDDFVIIANRGLWNYVPYQTAVDIARTVLRPGTERPDAMLAAQKLRDFAMSYGADGSTMIMVIWVADLFKLARSGLPSTDPVVDPLLYNTNKTNPKVRDRGLDRLDREVPPPTGHLTLVFTDIRNSTHLWEVNPGMPTAMRLHNNLLRRLLRFCGGYEVKTEGDAFMCSFPTALAAVWWCLQVQADLLNEPWPLEILECEDGKAIYDSNDNLIARGLCVRMGIHSGTPLCETDLITGRMDYFGPMVNRSARINGSALGGQIMCSSDIIREISARVFSKTEDETEYSRLQPIQAVEGISQLGVHIISVGEVKLKGIELPETLFILYPRGLEGRHDLKEPVVDPTASASRVQFSVPQIKELGLVCLRLEALSTGRIFKPLPERKASIQSNSEREDLSANPLAFYGDPNILLPAINDNSSDADLMLVLDSLSLRIGNAVLALSQRVQEASTSPSIMELPDTTSKPKTSTDALMTTLIRDGRLDEDILAYISSVLQR